MNTEKKNSTAVEINHDSLKFESLMEEVRLKSRLTTVDEKVKIRKFMHLICDSSLTIETRKLAYDELVNHNPKVFSGYFKNNKFDLKNLKIICSDYENSIDKIAFAQEFAKFSDSINR